MTPPKPSKRLRSPVVWILVAAVAMLSFMLTLALRPKPTEYETWVRTVEDRLGSEGPAYRESLTLLGKAATSQGVSDQEWQRLRQLMGHPNELVARNAYGALGPLSKTGRKSEVYEIIESLKQDKRKSVRNSYIHFAALTQKPGWREEAQVALGSPDPIVQENARSALNARPEN